MLGIIIFAAFAIFIVVLVIIMAGKNNKLLKEGKIIKRNSFFCDEAEMFFASAAPQTVVDSIRRTDFSDCKVDIEYGGNIIAFKSDYSWNASLEYLGTQGGRNVYRFSFPAYMSRNGMPYNPASMNIILTSIEKMFLMLDPQTATEIHKVKRKRT